MENTFTCLKFLNESLKPDPFSFGKIPSIDLPIISCAMTRLTGNKLDYETLSEVDLHNIIYNEKTNVIHFPEFNPEVIELAAQEIYSNTHKYIPNIVYAPETFDVSKLGNKEYKVFFHKELKDNQLVLLVSDEVAFPAYRDLDNNIQIHNPGLLMLIEVTPTIADGFKADAKRDAASDAKALESWKQARDRDQALEDLANAAFNLDEQKTLNTYDVVNGVWRETVDDQEDWEGK